MDKRFRFCVDDFTLFFIFCVDAKPFTMIGKSLASVRGETNVSNGMLGVCTAEKSKPVTFKLMAGVKGVFGTRPGFL